MATSEEETLNLMVQTLAVRRPNDFIRLINYKTLCPGCRKEGEKDTSSRCEVCREFSTRRCLKCGYVEYSKMCEAGACK